MAGRAGSAAEISERSAGFSIHDRAMNGSRAVPWLSLLIVSSVLASCSSSDGTRGAPGAPIAVTDFAALAAAAYCKSVTHCCSNGVADCVASVQAELQTILDGASAAQNVYDPIKARACVDAVSALEDGALCATWFMSGEASLLPCSGVLDGTVAPGQVCANVTNCQRGALNGTANGGFAGCAVYSGSSDTRCRAFSPVSGVGASCFDDHADPFAGSDPTVYICTSDFACVNGACASAAAMGQPCTTACQDSACVSGVCTPYAQEGAACPQGLCASGLTCSTTNGVCVADPAVPWILDVGFWSTSYSCPP